jgi:hypothetical protein
MALVGFVGGPARVLNANTANGAESDKKMSGIIANATLSNLELLVDP